MRDLNDDDLELAEFERGQEELENKKSNAAGLRSVVSGLGNVLQSEANVPSAYEYLYNKKIKPTDFQGSADRAASAVQDPTDPAGRSRKAMEYIKMKREGRMGAREESLALGADDPNSESSRALADQIGGVFPQFRKYVAGKSATQIRELMPILTQKARGDEDRALREQEMRMRNADRDEARRDKLDAKALKQQELSSTQAKQRGLYEMGKTAEQQFAGATADKNEYDPTASGQWIDNSSWAPNWMKNNKAIESQNARASWIESYLRDASGAAIPESERAAYAEIYFPMPGDTPTVVANKEQLRAQKMDSARIAAGVGTGHGPADVPLQSAKPLAPKAGGNAQQRAQAALERKMKAKQTAGN